MQCIFELTVRCQCNLESLITSQQQAGFGLVVLKTWLLRIVVSSGAPALALLSSAQDAMTCVYVAEGQRLLVCPRYELL